MGSGICIKGPGPLPFLHCYRLPRQHPRLGNGEPRPFDLSRMSRIFLGRFGTWFQHGTRSAISWVERCLFELLNDDD